MSDEMFQFVNGTPRGELRGLLSDAMPNPAGSYRGALVPAMRNADGSVSLAVPGMVRDGLLGLAELFDAGKAAGEGKPFSVSGEGLLSLPAASAVAGVAMAPRGVLASGAAKFPKVPDYTQTGYVFKDVATPSLQGRIKAGKQLEVPRYQEVELPIRSLYAGQNSVNPDFAASAATKTAADLPTVVKENGKYYVRDGHHRLTAQSEKGRQTANVALVDLDGTDRSTPLLDWKPEPKLSDLSPAQKQELDDLYNELMEAGFLGDQPSLTSLTDEAAAKLTPAERLDIAQRNAALPVEKGGLGLPPDNTPEMRAKAMGFDTDAYHGTASDFSEFGNRGGVTGARTARAASWAVDTPSVADGYADLASNSQVDKLIKASDEAGRRGNYDLQEKLYMQAEQLDSIYEKGQNVMPLKLRGNYAVSDMEGVKYDPADISLMDYVKSAKSAGNDGVKLQNFVDNADYSNYTEATHYGVFDPRNIRSRFAAFDPARKNSADLLAANPASGGLLSLPMLMQDQERKAKARLRRSLLDPGVI